MTPKPMTQDEQARIDEASEHPYECRCKICLAWWKAVGPERDGDEEPDPDEPAF